jgi:hypothetical protein
MHIIAAIGIAVVVASAIVAPASAQKATPNRPDQEGAWTIDESKSPTDGSPQITATLKAIDSDAKLTLRCKEKTTEAIFFRPMTSLGSVDSIKVLARIGSIETMLHLSTSGQSASATSAEQFIQQLPNNGTIFITATGGLTGKIAGSEFKLGNVSEIREKIAKACH